MSQFDVHRNPGVNREAIPYVVVVQSAAFDKLARRLVIPLLAVAKNAAVKIPYSSTTPVFTIKGKRVVLNPFDMVSVEVKKLGPVVASLGKHGDAIIMALDEVISTAHG